MLRRLIAMAVVMLLVMPIHMMASAANIQLSDAEFEESVAQIMKDYWEDPEAAEDSLKKIGAYLDCEPVIVEHFASANPAVRGTNPSDYTFYVGSIRRSNSNLRYLQWHLKANSNEWFEGPLDYVSMEWDTAYADYYDSSGDGVMVTVAGRNDGIVMFNLEDEKLGNGDSCYGTVRVNPISVGTMEFGSKFVHTYTGIAITGVSASWSFGPSAELAASGEMSLGLAYTFGFSVSLGSSTQSWNLWADNAVTFD